MNRSATASQSLGNPERKTLLAFLIQQNDLLGDLAGMKFLLKKERVFFFRGEEANAWSFRKTLCAVL